MTIPTDYVPYRRKGTVLARPYVENEVLPPHVSVSDTDRAAGSPKVGDMIARNFNNHSDPPDEWLIAQAYFEMHYEL